MKSFLRLNLYLLLLTYANAASDPSSNLDRVKHVVVLMMENCSFDHMFGYLSHTKMDNLLPNAKYVNRVEPDNPNSVNFTTGTGSLHTTKFDPGHGHESVSFQIYGKKELYEAPYPNATMSGFVRDAFLRSKESMQATEAVMKSFAEDELPMYRELARDYAVVDRWFSSVPGPTDPNRLFLNSASSYGVKDNEISQYILGYPQRTIFQSLDDAGKDFEVYFGDIPWVLLHRPMRKSKFLKKLKPFKGSKKNKGFLQACKEGTLKDYTLIEPHYYDYFTSLGSNWYANDDHPPHDIRRGQNLVKTVYEALRSSPQWNSTLLIITYDEHGGFHDHVPPPAKGVPNPDGLATRKFNFDRLGVRVPTLLISPWIEKGTVISKPPGPYENSEYEHSSIPATLKNMFGLRSFLNFRDRWAGTLEHLWTDTPLTEPRTDCITQLPDAFDVSKKEPPTALTETQASMLKLMRALNMEEVPSEEELQNIDPQAARAEAVGKFQRYLKIMKVNTTLEDPI